MTALVRLARRLDTHRRAFVVVALASLGVLLAGVVVSTASVAYAASLSAGQPLVWAGIALAVGVLAAAVLTWTEQWVAHVLAYQVIDRLRIELHRAIARLAPLGLARRTSGDTVSRAIGDVEALEWFYAHTAAQLLAGALGSLIFSAVAITFAGPAGLIVPLCHALIILIPLTTAAAARKRGDTVRLELAELSAVALSARRFARETVLLGQVDVLLTEITERTTRVQRAKRATAIRLGGEQAAYEIIGAVLAVSAVALTTGAITTGALPPPHAPVMIVFALSSTSAALVIASALGRIGEVQAAAARVDELLDAPSTRPDEIAHTGSSTSATTADAAPPPGVRVTGLRVAYPGTEKRVLSDIDLVAERGAILAVAGPSGAGKSTLLLAISRLIPKSDGRIDIDGTSIDDEAAAATRERVAVVAQHAHVFRASIRDNLLAPDADEDRVWRALDAARLTDHVRELPQGLDTVLDEAGANWSGGERQRLGLARGLIKDARVLLLDEPTAGLDPDTEAAFLSTLRSLAADRTIIIVTHRPAVLCAADHVVVLTDGGVHATGTHVDLLAENPRYRRLLADDAEY